MTIRNKISQIILKEISVDEKLKEICNYLKKTVPHFHWVGFYFVHGNKKELKLAQFAGKPTEHTIIPFGKGICGQVAVSNENFVVQDVNEQDNYISCGLEVKSEIVVPVFQKGINVGQIDIDSHDVAPFTKEDEALLEFVCGEVTSLDLNGILNRDPS
jgi:GAF domain-containing protein